MTKTAKTIADEVLTPARVRDLWTSNPTLTVPRTFSSAAVVGGLMDQGVKCRRAADMTKKTTYME